MRLYRIIDFFEFVQLLDDGLLRVPSAARFSDPNEFLGHLLLKFIDPSFSPYTIQEITNLINSNKLLRASHFVSCWTATRDSIAMWEIYSPTRNGVQVGIDKTDIYNAFDRFSEQHIYAKGMTLAPGSADLLVYPPDAGECQYLNLDTLYGDLRREFETFSNDFRQAILEDDKVMRTAVWKSAYENVSRRFDKLRFCKNEAYQHEREYRFQLRAAKRNDLSMEDAKKQSFGMLFDTYLRPVGPPEISENLFVPLERSTIKEVYLDGRSPEWLFGCQAKLLTERGISAQRSAAYGAFLDRGELAPWW